MDLINLVYLTILSVLWFLLLCNFLSSKIFCDLKRLIVKRFLFKQVSKDFLKNITLYNYSIFFLNFTLLFFGGEEHYFTLGDVY